MKYGFLYPVFKFLLDALKYLNLVELFKFIARTISSNKEDDGVKAADRVGTDIFIIFKWLLLIILWSKAISSPFVTFLIWYLLITNVYTYLFYHIWADEALKTDDFTKDRVRRRFLNLILAFTFSVYCFAYLYQIPYSADIDWGTKHPASMYSIMFSFSTSLAANYEDIKPKTDLGNIICNIELLLTFTFATIILSRSIPQTNSTT